MVGFKSKQIQTAPSLGEHLSQKRQERQLTIRQAASLTKISEDYLNALESANYERLPGDVYAKSFLKVYANFLGLNPANLIKLYQTEKSIYLKTKKIKINTEKLSQPVEKVARINFLVTPKIIRNIFIGALVVVFLVYLGVKVKAIFAPPLLLIYYPESNLVTSQRVIEIRGEIEKESTLRINGQQVLADSSGKFTEPIALKIGNNLIEITAKKKHSQPAVVYRQVVLTNEEVN